MLEKKDLKYCRINEESQGIFPTYFLLDLELTAPQKKGVAKLIKFLEDVKGRHTPSPPRVCPLCEQPAGPQFVDTWAAGAHIDLGYQIDALKAILEPNRWTGDHT